MNGKYAVYPPSSKYTRPIISEVEPDLFLVQGAAYDGKAIDIYFTVSTKDLADTVRKYITAANIVNGGPLGDVAVDADLTGTVGSDGASPLTDGVIAVPAGDPVADVAAPTSPPASYYLFIAGDYKTRGKECVMNASDFRMIKIVIPPVN